MKKMLIALAVLVAVAAFGYLNLDAIAPGLRTPADDSGSGDVIPVAPEGVGPVPDPRYRLVSLDVTTSTDTSFRAAMKAELVSALASYVPPKPEVTKEGVDAVAGLEVIIKLVGSDPLAYGQPHFEASIPGVGSLGPRPDMLAPGALEPGGAYDLWSEAEEQWSADYDAALAAAAEASAALDAFSIEYDEWSAITESVAALMLLAPEPPADVAVAVLSDLNENLGQQPASFAGAPIVVVQPDIAGDIAVYDSLFTNFSAWAAANGAGPVTRVRPEAAHDTIITFFGGK